MFELLIAICSYGMCLYEQPPISYMTESQCFTQGAILSGVQHAEYGMFTGNVPVDVTLECTMLGETTTKTFKVNQKVGKTANSW